MTNPAATPETQHPSGHAPRSPERQCAGCRQRAPANRLLRVAVGPQSQLVMDLYRRMPGRGAHVCAQPKCIQQAVERGTFSRSLKEPTHSTAQALCESAADGLTEQALARLGLGRRNATTRYGMDDVLNALAAQQARLVVLSTDVSPRTSEEIRQKAGFAGVTVVEGPVMEKLGAALGRTATGVVATCDAGIAKDVLWQLESSARLREGPKPSGQKRARGAGQVESGSSGA
jgi:predicted RNA-binding protein YlxR (DUF448 family)/ribosomal protein L30E